MQPKQSTREEYQRRINIIVEYINNHWMKRLIWDSWQKCLIFPPAIFIVY